MKKIKDLLEVNGEVTVQELCELLEVSAVTVRSYLQELEEAGLLRRTRGGGVLIKGSAGQGRNKNYSFFEYPENGDYQRRSVIAKLVADYVKPDSWIMIGAGKTCIEIARALAGFPVNVYTSNLEAALILSAGGSSNVMIPGGNVGFRGEYSFLYGEWFDNIMDIITVDQAFIGIAAISEEGLMVANPIEIQCANQILRIAREIVVVSDSEKFDKWSFLRIAQFDFMNTIICDDIPKKYQKIFEQHGVKMITPQSAGSKNKEEIPHGTN